MSTPATSSTEASPPQYDDRRFRSMAAPAGGGIVLAVMLWLAIDAMVRDSGRSPWIAAAVLVCFVPLVGAYTVRPAVFSGASRLTIRNPWRTIRIPWHQVESFSARYSTEVRAGGRAFQLWALPVSMRARKRAQRSNARAASGRGPARYDTILGMATRPGGRGAFGTGVAGTQRAWTDTVLSQLEDQQRRSAELAAAGGEIETRWCWWLIAWCVVGALLFALSLAL